MTMCTWWLLWYWQKISSNLKFYCVLIHIFGHKMSLVWPQVLPPTVTVYKYKIEDFKHEPKSNDLQLLFAKITMKFQCVGKPQAVWTNRKCLKS